MGRIPGATEFSFVGASGLDGVVGSRDCEPRAASDTAQAFTNANKTNGLALAA